MDNNNWRPSQGGAEPVMDTVDWRTILHDEARPTIVNKIMDTLKRHLPLSGEEGLQELKKIVVRFEEKIYHAAASPDGEEPAMDTVDWRTQLQNEACQMIVNKIMDTHLPFSGEEGLQELKKMAVRFEEKIYRDATSQSGYLRKISLKLLTMAKSQNNMANLLLSDADMQFSAGSSNSTAQTENAKNSGDWQKEIYQKIRTMMEAYLPELNEIYQKIAGKLHQGSAPPQYLPYNFF